jgi:SprT protein
MRAAKITGYDGEVRYYPKRNVWFGFMNGKVAVTKNTEAAVKAWFEKSSSWMPKFAPAPAKINVTNDVRIDLEHMTLMAHEKAVQLFPLYQWHAAPKVGFFNRGRVAGKAYYLENKVEYNEVLAKENMDTFNDTVLHEVAHLVTHVCHPFAKAHGPEFKRILIALGGNGKRCHNYDTSSVRNKTRKYVYTCGCKGIEHGMGPKRHAKAQRGGKFTCVNCRTAVTYTGKVVVK